MTIQPNPIGLYNILATLCHILATSYHILATSYHILGTLCLLSVELGTLQSLYVISGLTSHHGSTIFGNGDIRGAERGIDFFLWTAAHFND